jgi:hypothetical protein
MCELCHDSKMVSINKDVLNTFLLTSDLTIEDLKELNLLEKSIKN